jgi:hypothetical protein
MPHYDAWHEGCFYMGGGIMSEDNGSTYEKKVEARVRELDARMQLLKAKADKVALDAEAGGSALLKEAEKKRAQLGEQLGKLKNATGSALDEIKNGLSSAVDEFANTLDSAEKKDDQKS